jgi:hypothetical protein
MIVIDCARLNLITPEVEAWVASQALNAAAWARAMLWAKFQADLRDAILAASAATKAPAA